MFQGVFTALATPFKKDGSIDEKAYQDLIEWQILEGINGLVPCGTTGEAATMSNKEHMRAIALCVEAAHHRVPVLAGTGCNSTLKTIETTLEAKKLGIDGALVVAPYYNKPTQEGLYQHFKAVHDAVQMPIVLYNVPGRTKVDISVETVARLAKLPFIAGIKDATGDLARVTETKAVVKKEFRQLCGEDALALGFLAQGGDGLVSVSSNVMPRVISDIQKAWRAGDVQKAQELSLKIAALHKVMFMETNPMPVKYALSLMGKAEGTLRLPMVEVTDASKEKIKQTLEVLKVI
ncbi:MAG: 4-hydroxy-tetrahydrodipicolinate synthase [Alphaproteobacteria bacterium]|nr:4-hydroxy-tetrahydrodipicolinate synthase [Alphaproteobacteria bacterium]